MYLKSYTSKTRTLEPKVYCLITIELSAVMYDNKFDDQNEVLS